ncbi:retrovirus-related pol polyprotein from transposon TNT 1-94, partial [Tanacetum coccineum]
MVNDPLHIANFDHPGILLTNTPFNGGNFLAVIDVDYHRWIRCDYMVTCWILNSMIAELSESFLYAQSIRDLCKELEERYGHNNGPLIYHVKRELSKVTQGSSTVAAYFNKLKRFWDELHNLNEEISLQEEIAEEGHLFKQYFERLGYPDWYKGKKNKKGNKMVAQVLSNFSPYMAKETHFDFEYEHGMKGDKAGLDQRMVLIIMVANPIEFFPLMASDHMSPHLHLFHSIRVLKYPIKIKLPDGTSKWVDKIGHVQINSSLILHDVFYVPKFKDLSTKKVLAVGEGCNNLYICNPSSIFTSAKSTSIPAFSSFANKKDQVLSILESFLAYVENHFRVKPKFLRSDNGTEIVNNECLAYLRKLGLLDKFWGDCVLTATYLINKIPMKIIDWKTPFEMLHDNEDVPNAIHDTSVGENVSNDVEGVSNTEENVVPNTPDKTVPNIPPPAPTQVPNTRKSLRTSSQPYPNDYVASLANVLAIPEPVSCSQVIGNPKWVKAVNKELQALETNNTWTLTELHDGHKAISSKWVYKIKFYPDESVDKYKARLVIRGFSQKEGLDYKHTFSPVAKAIILRVLIAIATAKGWPLHQLDVNNAFLHGFVDEEIYMKPPEGYTKAGVGQVCRLNKSLYGLKQAFMQWNHELSKFLVSLVFVQSKHDYSLFVKVQGTQFTAVLVYVDDILLTGNSAQVICDTKAALDKKFTIKDLGLAIYFLGIELCNTTHGTYLHQMKYVLDLLKDAGLTAAKPTPFPLPQNLKLALNKGNPIADAKSYKRLVGRLLYLSMTRPDILYASTTISVSLFHLKELSESFLYAQSIRDLCKELEERYGHNNGPLIYHVKRELSKVTQGSSTVAAYFNKLKRFWDELHSLNEEISLQEEIAEVRGGMKLKDKVLKRSPYMAKETHFDFEYEHGMKGDKDLSTKKVLAVGEGCNNLYICKPSSTFTSAKSTSIPAFSSFANKKIVNNECLAYLRKLGIVHQKSMVYTPQQNAIVERKHRHLLDTARALKFHSGLLDKFWGDYVLTATYLINKMPMKIIDWKTPFEMLHDNEDVPNAIHDTSVGENVSNDVEGVSNTEENVVPNTPDKTVPNILPPAPTQVPNT